MMDLREGPTARVLLPAFVVTLSATLSATFSLAPPAIITAIIVAILPIRPFASPLMLPSRRRLVIPLLPVPGRHVIVPHWHEQEGPRHELGSNENPWTVVVTAHVPTVIDEGPILAAVHEEVGRCCRSVLHRRDAWDNHELRRRRKVDPNIYVHLSVGWPRQDEREQRDDSVGHEHERPSLSPALASSPSPL